MGLAAAAAAGVVTYPSVLFCFDYCEYIRRRIGNRMEVRWCWTRGLETWKWHTLLFAGLFCRGKHRSIADNMSFESMEEDTLLLPRLA
jgi:hypothetical protein